MPRYTFENKKTGKVWVDFMMITEMENYLKNNKHIVQVIQPINIVSGVQGMSYKTDGGWKDNLSRIAEAHPNSPLAAKYGKPSIKEVKTRETVKRHKLKRNKK